MRPPTYLPVLLLITTLAATSAQDGASGPASAIEAPEAVLKKLSVAPGLRVDLWAAEPLLANPVAFCFDEKGRVFVAETYRRRTSTPDIRRFEEWKLENLALRTAEDRLRFLQAKLPVDPTGKTRADIRDLNQDGALDFHDFAVESERLKLVIDSNGDGRADQSSVFAEGFENVNTGVGAGVAAHAGSVFYTCAPDLWRLDGEQKGAAVKRESLLTGFGVHVAFGGHDTHGPKIGPDGRIYWTVADCGASVPTREGTVLAVPDSGAVFRCELDGSNAELVAVGLRNPQSLAFNDVGDLFTGDNNADGGDKARWEHIIEGGDYGWRIGWQFLPGLGQWNREGTWQLDVGATNFAVIPPVGYVAHGPAGIAYYPGSGLPDAFRQHFFCADFPGGIRHFQITPRGASYTLENPGEILLDNSPGKMTGKVLWGLYPSDVQFGVDGGVYALDWVQGWDKTGKGRIFRVHDPVTDASVLVRETKRLLAADFAKGTVPELTALLGHADQRVRRAAQFELVRRGDPAPLAQGALSGSARLPRLHGIWGVSQLARRQPLTAPVLLPLAQDRDPEVRAQWAKFIGDARVRSENALLLRLLTDPEPRVRFFAAQALGRLRAPEAVPALFAMLQQNADKDAFLRAAGCIALATCAAPAELVEKAGDPSDAVRAGALLALRRQASPEVARFLADKNPQLVLEAARAIHDGAIPAAWPQLAALAAQPRLAPPLSLRALNANYLLGSAEAAQRLATIAAGTAADATLRLDAVATLAVWNQPFQRDRITGLWRNLPTGRDTLAAVQAAARLIPVLLKDGNEALRLAGAELAGALQVSAVENDLVAVATATGGTSGTIRAAALRALAALKSSKLDQAVKVALQDKDQTLVEAARQLAGQASPANAVKINAAVLGKGSIREQQEALATIAAQAVPEADQILATQLDLLLAGKLPAPLQLDLLEAAAQRKQPAIKQKLSAYEASRPATDSLAKWRECLEGGNAATGREIFAEKAEAACQRCHKVNGQGGDVGPELAGIGQRHDRQYLLQAIADPNAVIASGYQNTILTLASGEMVAGLLNSETSTEVTLASLTDGKKQQIKKADIKERLAVPSAMPPGLPEVLGKRGLRDVIEYLASTRPQ